MKRVIVVGGGIAGLTTAYRLRGQATVTLLEERPRLGGVILTQREAGFTIEGGPDSLLSTKPWALELCKELSLSDQIIRPAANAVHVLTLRGLVPMPDGVFLTVPTRLWPFLASPLFSWSGKLRMAMDLLLPRGHAVDDESIGAFFRRRLGREAVEKLAEPLMAGIYMGAADDISLRATFPRFMDLERDYRSLILGLRRQRGHGSHVSPFVSLRHGLGQLVDALVASLRETTIRTNVTVNRLERTPDSEWHVHLADGFIDADAIVLALPPPRAAAVVRSVAPILANAIDRIQTVGSTTVSLGFRGVRLPSGTGFVIPRRVARSMLACTWSSQKFDSRAPHDHVLLRCFMRDAPSDPIRTARDELRNALGITQEPAIATSFTWPGANPIYHVGHQALVREIELLTPRGLFLTGSGFRGTGIPDVVRDATRIAESVTRSL